ncbi:MAG: class I SAM-dependent methyltransferase [Armatimonadetes bacterium]|nr:class I SAM-dependent methyltransferase [Armatimonadota bacterium]
MPNPETSDSQFKLIAVHYDRLMAGVPYNLWVQYIEGLLNRIDYHPLTVLDVACGTGNVSELMADKGYEVVGVDISADMIEVAKSKGSDVEYHVQDIAELDLGRRFDLAISLFDSLNYITDVAQLAEGIRRVGEHLVDGGIFIFDINTEYALSHHFFDQASIGGDCYPKYVWHSDYDHATRICTVSMTFEVMENGKSRQFREVHIQRGHSIEELTMMLIHAGFDVLEIFHAYKFRRPTRRSDRVFFVARKRLEI